MITLQTVNYLKLVKRLLIITTCEDCWQSQLILKLRGKIRLIHAIDFINWSLTQMRKKDTSITTCGETEHSSKCEVRSRKTRRKTQEVWLTVKTKAGRVSYLLLLCRGDGSGRRWVAGVGGATVGPVSTAVTPVQVRSTTAPPLPPKVLHYYPLGTSTLPPFPPNPPGKSLTRPPTAIRVDTSLLRHRLRSAVANRREGIGTRGVAASSQ